MTLLQFARVGGVPSPRALSRWDGTRLAAHIEFTPRELTVTLINLSDAPVTVRHGDITSGRRRPPRELVAAAAHDEAESIGRCVAAGEAAVCARIPVHVLRTVISRLRLRPSRLRGHVTLDDGRVIVSERLRITAQ